MTKKILSSAVFCALFFAACTMAPNYNGYMQPIYLGPSIGLGTVIAVVVSWSRNKSILWAIIHGHIGMVVCYLCIAC
jgi:hypothetical protein